MKKSAQAKRLRELVEQTFRKLSQNSNQATLLSLAYSTDP